MAKTVGILLRNREQNVEAETTADPPGKAGVASVTLQRWDGSTESSELRFKFCLKAKYFDFSWEKTQMFL